MPRASRAALVAAAAVVAAGCGGGDSDKRQIESTLHDFYTAFSDADGRAACDQLAPSAQRDLAKRSGTTDCPAAIVKATKRPDIRPYTARLRNAKVVSVEVAGDAANAKVRAIGVRANVGLRKQGGDWKIDSGASATGS